ncbi:hypothetical protein AA313_de0202837 [Arthrobotrys entomopaga]|nr:hypothetical protein AA313_de0202837 [Arthrobotrys entomopaga]
MGDALAIGTKLGVAAIKAFAGQKAGATASAAGTAIKLVSGVFGDGDVDFGGDIDFGGDADFGDDGGVDFGGDVAAEEEYIVDEEIAYEEEYYDESGNYIGWDGGDDYSGYDDGSGGYDPSDVDGFHYSSHLSHHYGTSNRGLGTAIAVGGAAVAGAALAGRAALAARKDRGRGAARARGRGRGGRPQSLCLPPPPVCPPPLQHSATAPTGLHQTTWGRGSHTGRGRAAIAARGRGAHPGRGRGFTNTGAYSQQVFPANNAETLGPAPYASQVQPYNGVSRLPFNNNINYSGQTQGALDSSPSFGAPPPYSAAPAQRVQADPNQLAEMSKRKLQALQAIQRKEKDRIEMKRREEQEDREKLLKVNWELNGGTAHELPEQKVRINLPPGIKQAGIDQNATQTAASQDSYEMDGSSFVSSPEEPMGWIPPPLKVVKRRKFNSGEPEALDALGEPNPQAAGQQKVETSQAPTLSENSFALPPLPPSIPFEEPAPLSAPPEIPKGYYENMAPDVQVPGLTVRKSSLPASIQSWPTANMVPHTNTANMVAYQPSTQFQNQQGGHHSTTSNQASYSPNNLHETSTPTVTKFHPPFTKHTSPVTGYPPTIPNPHHSTTFPSQLPQQTTPIPPVEAYVPPPLPQPPQAPPSIYTHRNSITQPQSPNTNINPTPTRITANSPTYNNSPSTLSSPPSHIMELSASTGFANVSGAKSPYDMNPLIAELPEIPGVPNNINNGRVEDEAEYLNRREGYSYDNTNVDSSVASGGATGSGGGSGTGGGQNYNMSANSVSFGWESYY